MTTKRLRGTFPIYIILYSPYWRGLTALSILCELGDARAYESKIGRETDSCAFFVYQPQHIPVTPSPRSLLGKIT